jgi:DNA invertase Pin-like site-specific DNA recombinase
VPRFAARSTILRLTTCFWSRALTAWRSTRDLLNVLAQIDAKGACFRSLAHTWADTTTAHGRLILTVLGGLAEFERELIRARTSEGRARAKAQGVKLGRKPTLTQHQKQKQEAMKRRSGKESIGQIARSYNASRFRGCNRDCVVTK